MSWEKENKKLREVWWGEKKKTKINIYTYKTRKKRELCKRPIKWDQEREVRKESERLREKRKKAKEDKVLPIETRKRLCSKITPPRWCRWSEIEVSASVLARLSPKKGPIFKPLEVQRARVTFLSLSLNYFLYFVSYYG